MRAWCTDMPIQDSSIHRALGAAGELDHALVVRAIAERIPEDERLDWKRALPTDGDEAAKDVVAMANARGGLLVYGVAEDRNTARAAAAMPVSLAEREQRRIRAWLGTRVNPVVGGVEFVELRAQEGDTEGFVVVSVPESPDAPHMIGSENHAGFPYRMGAQTFWMREWDLERAYRDRFARRATEESLLIELVTHVADVVDLSSGPWLVGVARPSFAVHSNAPSPTRDDAVRILDRARTLAQEIAPAGDRRVSPIASLDQAALNPRVGLQRWVAATRADDGPGGLSNLVHTELHNDGSVVLALRLVPPGDGIDGKSAVADYLVTGIAVDLVALIESVAEIRGLTGQTALRVDIARAGSEPFALITYDRFHGLAQQPWTRDVRRFIPVHAVVPVSVDVEQMREAATMIASDVTTQFGFPPDQIAW